MQTTLDTTVAFEGKGLHSGETVSVVVRPAPADHGIIFRRTDVEFSEASVPALWHRVIVSPLNTRIENAHGTSVSTIEHIMAALAEFERDLISERTKEGMRAAKQRGAKIGRPKKLSPAQLNKLKLEHENGASVEMLAKTYDVHPRTVYRIVECE